LQALREETGGLKKPLQSVRQVAGDLMNEAGEHGVDASHLQDEVDNLADRLDDLQAKLDDRCSELQSAATAVTQFNVSTSLAVECKAILMHGRSRFCLTHEAGIYTVSINSFI
jgi:chromosome segregation ATPase